MSYYESKSPHSSYDSRLPSVIKVFAFYLNFNLNFIVCKFATLFCSDRCVFTCKYKLWPDSFMIAHSCNHSFFYRNSRNSIYSRKRDQEATDSRTFPIKFEISSQDLSRRRSRKCPNRQQRYRRKRDCWRTKLVGLKTCCRQQEPKEMRSLQNIWL